MKPSIQNMNLEDITITATPDLFYFELVIFLILSLYHTIIVNPSLSYVHLPLIEISRTKFL